MTGIERRPRAFFTKKLHRVLEVLESGPERRFDYQQDSRAPHGSCLARALRVWVCGSYARGALECGDLDLVVQFEYTLSVRSAGMPPARHTRRAFWGSIRDVQVFEGQPVYNSSRADMSDHAVLVWEKGMDWRSAVAAIPVSSGAGRFARLTDTLPVDPGRLRMQVDEARELAHAHGLGMITWRWESFGGVSRDVHPHTADEEAAAHWVAHARGAEAQAVFGPLMVALRRLKSSGHVTRATSTRGWNCQGSDLLWEGYVVQLGYSRTSVQRLAEAGPPRGFILVPYLKRAGPNGLWLIERGPLFSAGMTELRRLLWRDNGVELPPARQ